MTNKFTKNREAFLKLKKPKAVIFDWDNTLVDTWPLIHSAIDKTMIAMGHEPWGLEKVRDTIHKSMRESFPEIFGDKWEEAGEMYKNHYRAIHLEIQLLKGSLQLIDTLEKLGITQFIVSNKIGPTLRKEVKSLGITEKFFSIIGAHDAACDKPGKEPVELALLGSDLHPEKDEIWFIGDTIADIDCAYNTKCRPIVYGHSDTQVSKTIPEKLLLKGKDQKGEIPLYFDHLELVKLLNS